MPAIGAATHQLTGDSMAGAQDDGGSPGSPTPRELRAARQRAHEIEKEGRKKPGGGGKSDKKGTGSRQPDDENRHRR